MSRKQQKHEANTVQLEAVSKTGQVLFVRDFAIEHASNLLRMGEKSGWHLPENSNWEYSQRFGLIKKT